MLLFGTAFSIILGIKLAQRFIVPINLLADAAKKISQGDLTARVESSMHHTSEIAKLMHNFNHMAQSLKVQNAHVWNAAIAHEFEHHLSPFYKDGYRVLSMVFLNQIRFYLKFTESS